MGTEADGDGEVLEWEPRQTVNGHDRVLCREGAFLDQLDQLHHHHLPSFKPQEGSISSVTLCFS